MLKIRKKALLLKLKGIITRSINKKILYIASIEAFGLGAMFLVLMLSGLALAGMTKITKVDFQGITMQSAEAIKSSTNSLLLFLAVFVLVFVIAVVMLAAAFSVAGAIEWKIASQKSKKIAAVKKSIKKINKKHYIRFFLLNAAYIIIFLFLSSGVVFIGTVLALIGVALVPSQITYIIGKFVMFGVVVLLLYPLFIINVLFAKTGNAAESFVKGIRKYFSSWVFIVSFAIFFLIEKGIGLIIESLDMYIKRAIGFPLLSLAFLLIMLAWLKTASYEMVKEG